MKPEKVALLAVRLRAQDFELSMYDFSRNLAAAIRIARLEGRAIKVTNHGYPVAVLQPLGVPASE